MKSYTDQAKAELFFNEGNVSAKMGMFENALSLYDQAITLDDANPMYYNNRAATLKRLGRFQEAIKQYEEIVHKFPDYGKAFLCISSTCIETGNYQGAVSSYRRFLDAYNNGQFTFNPIWGEINQSIYGESLLETALLTSINYLSVDQQGLAIQAFQEAQ
ncbi:MAG: tetratricopeptide repeat protein [Nostoc sp.]|uniref:tetratricopeptide repeat protein n=1 Tax=unclassified Nostoc TaxID=2593658 RepID=UPI0025F659B4|nr:tetratricopeptide repeat protein [Nostoc sp. NMS9]MBN3940300.1 tetratricopeptide repeat protein [Nostoc sp. NMS9]